MTASAPSPGWVGATRSWGRCPCSGEPCSLGARGRVLVDDSDGSQRLDAEAVALGDAWSTTSPTWELLTKQSTTLTTVPSGMSPSGCRARLRAVHLRGGARVHRHEVYAELALQPERHGGMLSVGVSSAEAHYRPGGGGVEQVSDMEQCGDAVCKCQTTSGGGYKRRQLPGKPFVQRE